jgi:heme-degrading monooxygenase HmoA
MSVVVINAVTVPAARRDEFEQRFAARAGQVSEAPGFEAFELLRPTDGDRFLVYTRWRTREDFEAWMGSSRFAAGHRQHAEGGRVSRESEVWEFEVLQSEYGTAAQPSSRDLRARGTKAREHQSAQQREQDRASGAEHGELVVDVDADAG